MPRVQTYVFIDLETTGLPKEEFNKTRITELSMIAVKRQHLLDTRAGATPRVQHKLTLCVNPRRMISDSCTAVTGLDNFLLEEEPDFKEVFTMIDTFLSVLSQPVCLIAQNGLKFDYPILKNHLVKLKVDFTADVLCADCYHGFYHILEKLKLERNVYIRPEKERNGLETAPTNPLEISPSKGSSVSPTNVPAISPTNDSVILASDQTNLDETDFHTSNISMQAVNETTPKSTKTSKAPKPCFKAKRKLDFPWGDGPKPADSYKLKNIYERVLNKPAVDAHRAENDCMFALEISAALSKQFVEWTDDNNLKFAEIVPMTVGVPM